MTRVAVTRTVLLAAAIGCGWTGRGLAETETRPTTGAQPEIGNVAKRVLPARQPPRLPPPRHDADASEHSLRLPGRTFWSRPRLGAIVAIFFALIAVQRCLAPRGRAEASRGMIQLCGKVPLDARRSLQLVRVGQRVLVLLESPQGMQRLAEISDPAEVARILGGEHSYGEQRPA